MLKKVFAASAVTVAAAGVLLTGSPAQAATGVSTSGAGSVLGGNAVTAELKVPVNACGNAIAILGRAGASCSGSGASIFG